MALLGSKIARTAPSIDLSAYAIDEASMQWLEDRLGSRKPKVSAVDSLARSQLGPQEQRFMRALLEAMRAGGRDVSVSVTHNGTGDAQRAGFMQATLHAATREDEVVSKVRGAVEAVLWGQERHLDAFVLVASDHVSTTRTLPAILVVGGERGHGKTEAVAALANGLHARPGKTHARVHDVDLSTVTDASADALFEEGGPLSAEVLRKLIGNGIVCFHGANDLQIRAPQLTLRLQQLLGTPRKSLDYKPLVYVFDFDQLDGTVEDTMAKALGAVGTYMASDYATFGHLDADTMRRYCLARLPELLKSKELGDMRVDFDDAALAVIGAALATPHVPLQALDARVHQLILNHLDVADDGNRRAPKRVQMTVAADADEVASVIANLTSPVPKLSLARKLLRVEQVIVEEEKAPDAPLGAPPATEVSAGATTQSSIAKVISDVVARAKARAIDELYSTNVSPADRHLEMLASLGSGSDRRLDLLAAIHFVSGPRSVDQVEADTAIAYLASIDVSDDGATRYQGETHPRRVVATLETLSRVRHASPAQVAMLRGLADGLAPGYARELADAFAKIPPASKDDFALVADASLPGYALEPAQNEVVDSLLRTVANEDTTRYKRLSASFDLVTNPGLEAIPSATAIALLAHHAADPRVGSWKLEGTFGHQRGRLAKYAAGLHQYAAIVALESIELAVGHTESELDQMESFASIILGRLPDNASYQAILRKLVEGKRTTSPEAKDAPSVRQIQTRVGLDATVLAAAKLFTCEPHVKNELLDVLGNLRTEATLKSRVVLDMVAHPTNRVHSLEADTAIALLAAVDPKEAGLEEAGFVDQEVAKGRHSHLAVIALETVARVRHATSAQRQHLNVLANGLIQAAVAPHVKLGHPLATAYEHILADLLEDLQKPGSRHAPLEDARRALVAVCAQVDAATTHEDLQSALFTTRSGKEASALDTLRVIVGGERSVAGRTPMMAAYELFVNDEVATLDEQTAMAVLAVLTYAFDPDDFRRPVGVPTQDVAAELASYGNGRQHPASIAAIECVRRAETQTPQALAALRKLAARIISSAPPKDEDGALFPGPGVYLDLLDKVMQEKQS